MRRHLINAGRRTPKHRLPDNLFSITRNYIDVNNIICPKCGRPMAYVPTSEVHGDNAGGGKMLMCKEDDVYCRTRKTNSGKVYLVSTPADAKLRKLRQEAHFYFNQLISKDVFTGIDNAYEWLSQEIGFMYLGRNSLRHIGEFDEALCKKTVRICIQKLIENPEKINGRIIVFTGDNSYSWNDKYIRKQLAEFRDAWAAKMQTEEEIEEEYEEELADAE